MRMTYYLAYGSNLDINRMVERCPDAIVVGTTEIPGYRLLFKKSLTGFYATIEQDANCSVPAAVWRISAYDEVRLDCYEGFPKYYYKKHFMVPVWNRNGKRLKKDKDGIAYVLHEERLLGEPSKEYFALILNGYRYWGFPEEILAKGLSDSIGEKALDRYEGYPGLYRKEEIPVMVEVLNTDLEPTGEKRELTAMVYIMNKRRKPELPGYYYGRTLAKAYSRFGFDMHVLRTALQETKLRMQEI